jgi:hypothetical protein
LEPRKHIGVQTQRDRLLHRPVHPSPLLRKVPRTPFRPRRRLNFCHFARCPCPLRNSFPMFHLSPIVSTQLY